MKVSNPSGPLDFGHRVDCDGCLSFSCSPLARSLLLSRISHLANRSIYPSDPLNLATLLVPLVRPPLLSLASSLLQPAPFLSRLSVPPQFPTNTSPVSASPPQQISHAGPPWHDAPRPRVDLVLSSSGSVAPNRSAVRAARSAARKVAGPSTRLRRGRRLPGER